MVISFITCISALGDVYQPQMGTRKAKSMESVLLHYNRVAKASRHQAPDAADQEVNSIGSCNMESRADTCFAGNNWRLLSTTGQLCDVK